MVRFYRSKFLLLLLGVTLLCGARVASAAPEKGVTTTHEKAHGEEKEAIKPVFEPEHGTWFNVLSRSLLATPEEKQHMRESEVRDAELKQRVASGQKLSKKEAEELEKGVHYVAKYDFLIFTPILWALLAVVLVSAARKGKIRPVGKATSSASVVEAMVDGFQNYLIGVMGEKMARKYLPLIASFFFTILVSNYIGLVPGMLAPSAMPAIPIALAITAFFATHIVAIKETGFKSWILHFVGEPVWLAPLNFPLHLVGELIKPISLSLRLLCNIFGEEQVVATLIGLAILALPAWLPIPFQLPMLFLGVLFGFLQALVFSTLLAIYISVLSTHHDEDHEHGHTEHAVDSNGHKHIVAIASVSPVA